MNNQHSQYGMTLAEVLIAIAIFAAMAATLTVSTRSVLQASARVTGSARISEAHRSATETVDALLSSMIIADPESGLPRFSGGARQMTFLTSPPDGNLTIVTLSTVPGAGVAVTTSDPFQSEVISRTFRVYSSREDLAFSYYGARERDDLDWDPRWEEEGPPRLIRISDQATDHILLELSIDAQAPLTCQFDPVSRLCRSGS